MASFAGMDNQQKIVIRYLPVILRRFRYESGMTQEQLSERVGISASYLGMMEVGRRWPNIDMLFRIADALAVPPDSIIRAVDEERKRH